MPTSISAEAATWVPDNKHQDVVADHQDSRKNRQIDGQDPARDNDEAMGQLLVSPAIGELADHRAEYGIEGLGRLQHGAGDAPGENVDAHQVDLVLGNEPTPASARRAGSAVPAADR